MKPIENILDLFKIINTGQSVVYNRIDTWWINDKETKKLKKIWQLEKVSEHEYCYKTFDGYGKGIKHLFFIDSSKADRPISEYYDNFREALCTIMSHVLGDKEMLSKIASDDLLLYNGYTLNYSDEELFEDRKIRTCINSYEFTSFKTRQTLGSNKSGEEAIREVLNTHIANMYPDGIRHDEYMTMYSNSRADSVVFNKDSIHVYEIKSAKDSFTRLESQIEDYKRYADKITLVMDIKKRSAFIKNHAHKYKGVEVLFYYGSGLKLERESRGKKLNPMSKKFELLWKDELYEQVLWFIPKISKLSQYKLFGLATAIFTKKQAHDIANEVLYTRHKKSIGLKKMNRGNVNMDKIFQKHQLQNSTLQIKADKYLRSLK